MVALWRRLGPCAWWLQLRVCLIGPSKSIAKAKCATLHSILQPAQATFLLRVLWWKPELTLLQLQSMPEVSKSHPWTWQHGVVAVMCCTSSETHTLIALQKGLRRRHLSAAILQPSAVESPWGSVVSGGVCGMHGVGGSNGVGGSKGGRLGTVTGTGKGGKRGKGAIWNHWTDWQGWRQHLISVDVFVD